MKRSGAVTVTGATAVTSSRIEHDRSTTERRARSFVSTTATGDWPMASRSCTWWTRPSRIAPGLYLGQLLFAAKHLLSPYEPALDPQAYGYRHFGYFLLFTDAWNAQARSLFPHLGIPATEGASGTVSRRADAATVTPTADRFRTLTLADPLDGTPDPAVLEAVENDIAAAGDVLRALQLYAKAIDENATTDASVVAKLHTWFNAGICPSNMDGFYHGALVGWLSPEPLAPFAVNTVQGLWRVIRPFSPWTGKCFDPIDRARLERSRRATRPGRGRSGTGPTPSPSAPRSSGSRSGRWS